MSYETKYGVFSFGLNEDSLGDQSSRNYNRGKYGCNQPEGCCFYIILEKLTSQVTSFRRIQMKLVAERGRESNWGFY